MLVREGHFPPNGRGINGNTALHIAVEANQPQIAKWLLSLPAPAPCVFNLSSMAPLDLACANGCLPVLKELLKYPLIFAGDSFRPSSPLQTAFQNRHFEAVKLLLRDRRVFPGPETFCQAIELGSPDLIDAFLGNQAIDPNPKMGSGEHPIHFLFGQGNYEGVKRFLRHPQVDINVLDGKGRTLFFKVCWEGIADLFEALLQCEGLDANLPFEGMDPLRALALREHGPLFEALLFSKKVRNPSLEPADQIPRVFVKTLQDFLSGNLQGSCSVQRLYKRRAEEIEMSQSGTSNFFFFFFFCSVFDLFSLPSPRFFDLSSLLVPYFSSFSFGFAFLFFDFI